MEKLSNLELTIFISYILPLTAREAGVAPQCVKPKEPENPVLVSLREAGSPASG